VSAAEALGGLRVVPTPLSVSTEADRQHLVDAETAASILSLRRPQVVMDPDPVPVEVRVAREVLAAGAAEAAVPDWRPLLARLADQSLDGERHHQPHPSAALTAAVRSHV